MKNNLITKNFFNITGFFIIFIFFWYRFLREKNQTNFITDYRIFFISFFIIIIIYFMFIIIKSLFKIIYDDTNLTPNKLIKFIYKYPSLTLFLEFLILLKDSPKSFYENSIYPRFHMVYIIEKPVYFVVKKLAKKPKDVIYIFFSLIPKIILAFSFFLTVFFIKDFIYFKKIIILCILPLFYNVYFYIVKHFCKESLLYFRAHLKLLKSDDNNLYFVLADETPNYPDAIDLDKNKNNTQILLWLVNNFDIYSNINSFLNNLEKVEQFYKPYESTVTCSLYVCVYTYFIYNLI